MSSNTATAPDEQPQWQEQPRASSDPSSPSRSTTSPSRETSQQQDGIPEKQQSPLPSSAAASSLAVPDITHLSINTDKSGDGPRDHHRRIPAVMRSVSDVGPPRQAPPIASIPKSSQSSGTTSPLAHVQAARSSGIGPRPPSSSGSTSSGLSGGVSKLPAGMQAKMMAVTTRKPRTLPSLLDSV
jgi:hypothetical protein